MGVVQTGQDGTVDFRDREGIVGFTPHSYLPGPSFRYSTLSCGSAPNPGVCNKKPTPFGVGLFISSALPDVEDRDYQQPHHVHEVPVQAGGGDRTVVGPVDLACHRLEVGEGHAGPADQDV